MIITICYDAGFAHPWQPRLKWCDGCKTLHFRSLRSPAQQEYYDKAQEGLKRDILTQLDKMIQGGLAICK